MNKLIQLLFITMMMNTAKSQTPGQIKQIDSLMQSANLRGVFNGNILVAQKDKIIYKKSWGFADASKNKLLNIDLLFDIGSISKEFNGVSIMLLKEQGKLKLDDPISKFLPDLPEWSKNVQIKHLINYTSGIPNFVAQSDETDEELMDYLKNLKALSFEPGTAYIYAHGNVYLQKRIIEKISGLSYANFVSKYILKPNNMSHTIIDADLSSPDVAKAFDNEFKPTSFIQVTTGFPRISINDLYQFIRSLENFKIMNQESFNQLSDNFPGGESSLGSTVFENERLKSHRHQGSNSGYEALIYTDHILGIDVIIETNNQNFKVDAIKNAIFAILQNQTYTVPKKSVYLDIRDKVLDNLEQGLAFYRKIKATQQNKYDFNFEVSDLISTGKYLQRRSKFEDAIIIYQIASLLKIKTGDLSYVYELIGECYQKKGATEQALLYYEKALNVNVGNKNAEGMIDKLMGQINNDL